MVRVSNNCFQRLIYLLPVVACCFLCSCQTKDAVPPDGTAKPENVTPTITGKPDRTEADLGQEGSGTTVSIQGIVSDSMCGANHKGMLATGSMGDSDRTCVIECVRAGSKFVLVDGDGKTIWRLSNQQLASQYAGAKVTVFGTVKPHSDELTVQRIQSLNSN